MSPSIPLCLVLAATVVTAVIFLSPSLFGVAAADPAVFKAEVVEKIQQNGSTRCVVEIEQDNKLVRFVVAYHLCYNKMGTWMDVTKHSPRLALLEYEVVPAEMESR